VSFGDEHDASPFFDPLTPRRVVIPLRPHKEYGAPARSCSRCSDATREPGTLCSACRRGQEEPVSAAFLQSTVADTIRNLERAAEKGGAPMALPVAQALAGMRKLFDSCEPLIHSLNVGIVQPEEGVFFAIPYLSTERLGPYGSRNLAEHALVQHALDYGNWDTEMEG
jgi:hypothetical protein